MQLEFSICTVWVHLLHVNILLEGQGDVLCIKGDSDNDRIALSMKHPTNILRVEHYCGFLRIYLGVFEDLC